MVIKYTVIEKETKKESLPKLGELEEGTIILSNSDNLLLVCSNLKGDIKDHGSFYHNKNDYKIVSPMYSQKNKFIVVLSLGLLNRFEIGKEMTLDICKGNYKKVLGKLSAITIEE